MKPILCGYHHEWRGLNKITVSDEGGPLCLGKTRMNNPGCAHCLADGMRIKMQTSLPWLEKQIHEFREQTYENRGANTFLIELTKAIECDVFDADVDVLSLKPHLLVLVENAIARENEANVLTENSTIFFTYVREMIEKIFDTEKREGPEIGRLHWYLGIVRQMIEMQDRWAQSDVEDEVYDRDVMLTRQQFIVEQLELVKKYLLDAIDQKLTALRSGN